jgi:hypothetical protein
MLLEQQLAALEEFGFTLEPGVTIDDLLYSGDRSDFESQPFDLIFFVLSGEIEREPWDRRFCRRIWNLDYECIEEDGDYLRIVEQLCAVAGRPDALHGVSEHIDLDRATGWLKYVFGGIERVWDVKVDGDWADPKVIANVMGDLESGGRRFFGLDNGQAMIICYLDGEQAAKLNRLSKSRWSPMVPNEEEKANRGLLGMVRRWFR